MEALGIAASIIAVVQISAEIIAACTRYIEEIHDAPKDLKNILVEISVLKGLFEPLKVVLGSSPETAALDAQLSKPVDGCLSTLKELSSLLDTTDTGGFGGDDSVGERHSSLGKRRMVALATRLAWPLKKGRANRLLFVIGQYKGSITVILNTHEM